MACMLVAVAAPAHERMYPAPLIAKPRARASGQSAASYAAASALPLPCCPSTHGPASPLLPLLQELIPYLPPESKAIVQEEWGYIQVIGRVVQGPIRGIRGWRWRGVPANTAPKGARAVLAAAGATCCGMSDARACTESWSAHLDQLPRLLQITHNRSWRV